MTPTCHLPAFVTREAAQAIAHRVGGTAHWCPGCTHWHVHTPPKEAT